jgi:uncharacterized integral membrane protein
MMNDPKGQAAKAGSGWTESKQDQGIPKALIAFVIVAVLALVFVFGNTDTARIRFLIPTVEAPMWVLVVLCIAIGAALDRAWIFSRRRRKSARRDGED